MDQAQEDEEKEWFEEHQKTLLRSLYNPALLRSSPLTNLLCVSRKGDPITLLRDTLLEGIEALRPGHNTPRDSRTWRIYTILRRRYVEQIEQEIVAKDMGLSVRQLQREEKFSRQVLVDHLWLGNNLENRRDEVNHFMAKRDQSLLTDEGDDRRREIAWLRETVVMEGTDISLFIRDVFATAAPFLQIHRIEVQQQPIGNEFAFFPASLVRQAMLNILIVLSKTFPDGSIRVTYSLLPSEITICIECSTLQSTRVPEWDQVILFQQYEDAVSLLGICDGQLTVSPLSENSGCCTKIRIPLQRQLPVLVIDDNSDSLVLMERYLAGSPYLYYGVRDSRLAVEMAEEVKPDVIVMDVMMPNQDGWTLLGLLREHPSTQHIPVIICTILAQRDLAFALGAADFLRKPISRKVLLETLGRLLASQLRSSD